MQAIVMPTVRIEDKDKGYTARLRAIKSLDGKVKARVGVMGEKATALHDEKSGLTTVELAAIHEFGLGVSERSFIRDWCSEDEKINLAALKVAAAEVVAGRANVAQALEAFGRVAKERMLARIEAYIPPALSPVTVTRKGHDLPLVDTGKLVAAIDNDVKRGGK